MRRLLSVVVLVPRFCWLAWAADAAKELDVGAGSAEHVIVPSDSVFVA